MNSLHSMLFGLFRCLVLCFVSVSVHLSALQAEQHKQDTLTFGIYAAVKPSEAIAKFLPVTRVLQSKMSEILNRPITIEYTVAAKYQEGIDNIVQGNVDFSRLGPASYVEAREANPALTLIAADSKDGSTVDYGIICVHADSAIRSVADLRGKTFAFGDELSTIGRYLSQQHLLQAGISASDLNKYEYLGRHDAVGAAVGAGRFDAGALKEETFNKLKAAGTPLRELARFPNASQAWVVRSGLDAELLKALQQAFYSLEDPKALKALDADEIVPGDEDAYTLIREAIRDNHKFFK